jgi:hypothetical protein
VRVILGRSARTPRPEPRGRHNERYEVVQHNSKTYNAHDAEALAATYGEGATYSNPRAGKGFTGKAIANYAKSSLVPPGNLTGETLSPIYY